MTDRDAELLLFANNLTASKYTGPQIRTAGANLHFRALTATITILRPEVP